MDPLGPDNPIIFAVGPLVGLYPLASKTVAMFKSPLTGNLGESHAGGRSAVSIRAAGYGAIVIKGKSETPVYLSIDSAGVRFRDATGFWGVVNSVTVGRIVRELETGSGMRTIMRIGGAGERMVKYACVTTETRAHLDTAGYSLDQKILKGGKMSDEEVVEALLAEEAWRQVLSSLVICFFARGLYEPDLVVRTLETAGHKVDEESLNRLGLKILREKNRFKMREGFDPWNIRIPRRVFETMSSRGLIEEASLRESIRSYFEQLGL